jgi:DNA-binding Lrp family transcriptional regulator
VPDRGPPLRAIARIVDAWSLDIISGWLRFFGGDTRLAEIGVFIRIANTEHLLDDPVLAARYRRGTLAPGDCRPVSIGAIADGLGFDIQTVRRKIAVLQADGRCRVDERGIVLQVPDGGGAVFVGQPGDLPAQLATLLARLRALVVDNGYDAGAIAELRAAIDHDFGRLAEAETLVDLVLCQYLARSMLAGAQIFGSDRDSAVIYFTIYVESGRDLAHDPQLSRADAWIESDMPDGGRQSVTVRAIARRIGLPAESVRRKVKRLIDRGLIERMDDGVAAIRTRNVVPVHAPRAYANLLSTLAAVRRITLAEPGGSAAS